MLLLSEPPSRTSSSWTEIGVFVSSFAMEKVAACNAKKNSMA
jgi:hypothetical protein